MTPERIVYADTPEFIPIPKAPQHRRVEVILWPLEEEPTAKNNTSNWLNFFSQHSRQVDDITPFVREELYAERLR